MIYVDQLRPHGGGLWCHLWGDTNDELAFFANLLGLRYSWKDVSRKRHHFDLTPGKRRLAVAGGAKETSTREFFTQRNHVSNNKSMQDAPC